MVSAYRQHEEMFGIKTVDRNLDIEGDPQHPTIIDNYDYRRGPLHLSVKGWADPVFEDPNLDIYAVVPEDDSPYPEVRSAVPNTDDPDMHVNTIRAWVIGIICAIIIPGLNQLLSFRYPSVTISGLVAQLLSFPIGCAWASFMPRIAIFGIALNPGPFTVKEHVLVTVMASVGASSSYATLALAAQRVYYGQNYSFGYQWLVVMSTQLIGFSIGGIARRFLVSPSSMIWPANLVLCTLFNTLHSQEYSGVGSRGGNSRKSFFLYIFLGSFFWYFFPGYIFTALSVFNWVCWIAPTNVIVNQMFGYSTGLGMSLITFDWSQITYVSYGIGSPLATPWWVEANVAAAFIFFAWMLTPILYYSNAWYSQYMPMSTRGSYDNTGDSYNVTRILNGDATFNATAYHAYSPFFLPTTFALTYGFSYASITATIVHAILYFRKQIFCVGRRSGSTEQPDIHAWMMTPYASVPEWWYLCIFGVMFIFSIVSIKVWPTQMPIWAFILALIISFVFTIPVGMLQAITNQQIALNCFSELIIGYTLPGRPIAMMLFKTWAYNTIPPQILFWCQIVATVIAGTVQLAVQAWMFANIPDFCASHQEDGFVCPNVEVFGTASVIWGVIGPALQFSKGQVYYALLWFFLIGAIAPVVPWAITRKYPNSFWKYVNLPVIFTGPLMIPPASGVNYVTWAIVGFVFQYIVRRRHFDWWTKYNYILSAALDSGVAISVIFVFFCLQYPKNGMIGATTIQKWWGNTVWVNTADYRGTPLRQLGDGETFGPSTW